MTAIDLAFTMPVTRPELVPVVLDHLNNQTLIPKSVLIVDNSGRLKLTETYDFEVAVKTPFENLGVNPVWNMALLQAKTKYTGFLPDDLRLETRLCEKLIALLESDPDIGAAIPTTVRELPLPVNDTYSLRHEKCTRGKGNAYLVIMPTAYAKTLPVIPKELKIYFGDVWLHYWMKKDGKVWARMRDCHVYHPPFPKAMNIPMYIIRKMERRHARRLMDQ